MSCGQPEVKSSAVSYKAQKQFKQRIRWLTRRSCGRSLQQVADNLRPYLLGWKAYFTLSQTPAVWRKLDEWIRHRLRAIQLRQWKRGPTIYRELRTLGASQQVAQRVASNSHRWWRNSRFELNRVLNIAWFDRLGLARLS
jgi:RNA-directed DNA polymerase